ncbi:MAG: peptidase dimerization domain-containing protein [Bacillus subtilis]|nr:peptidase dimerization domain-containing protein [Bacillus subtilis]
MQKGSDADNVIPAEAYVVCNMRTHPIQNVAESVGVLKKIAAKHDIQTEILYAHESSPTVNTNSPNYRTLVQTVARHYPDVMISPYVILGATDARHYTQVSDCVIRFSPMRATNSELKKFMASMNRFGSIPWPNRSCSFKI